MGCSVELFAGSKLENRIGFSSSQFTGTKSALAALAPLSPPFVTLKTTSSQGGSGKGQRRIVKLDGFGLGRSIMPTGPKELELWDFETSLDNLKFAKRIFSTNTKIGVSILAGERYDVLMPPFQREGCDYLELNLKYEARRLRHLRSFNPQAYICETFESTRTEIRKALECSSVPVLVKFARDLPWLAIEGFMAQIAEEFRHSHIGFILANTRQYIMPPDPRDLRYSYAPGIRKGVFRAPICGEFLFPETLDLIWRMKPVVGDIPIIASGGAVDIYHIIALLGYGAEAVQLCTVFEYHPLTYFLRLRQGLKKLEEEFTSVQSEMLHETGIVNVGGATEECPSKHLLSSK